MRESGHTVVAVATQWSGEECTARGEASLSGPHHSVLSLTVLADLFLNFVLDSLHSRTHLRCRYTPLHPQYREYLKEVQEPDEEEKISRRESFWYRCDPPLSRTGSCVCSRRTRCHGHVTCVVQSYPHVMALRSSTGEGDCGRTWNSVSNNKKRPNSPLTFRVSER